MNMKGSTVYDVKATADRYFFFLFVSDHFLMED